MKMGPNLLFFEKSKFDPILKVRRMGSIGKVLIVAKKEKIKWTKSKTAG